MDSVEEASALLCQTIAAEVIWRREVTGDVDFRIERYLCKPGQRLLPVLPCPAVGVQLGGKKVLALRPGKSIGNSAVSIPSVTLIIPATKESYWDIGGMLDFVMIYFRGTAQRRYRELIADIQYPLALGDSVTGVVIKQLLSLLLDSETDKSDTQIFRQRKAHINTLGSTFFHQVCYLLEDPAEHIDLDTVTAKYPAVYDVVTFVNDNLSRKLSIAELAKQSGLQQSQFRNVFKRVTGLSPHQFVIRARLERAHELLINTEMSLISLVAELGFSSQSHLTKAFKGRFGVTPSQVRQQRLTDTNSIK